MRMSSLISKITTTTGCATTEWEDYRERDWARFKTLQVNLLSRSFPVPRLARKAKLFGKTDLNQVYKTHSLLYAFMANKNCLNIFA